MAAVSRIVAVIVALGGLLGAAVASAQALQEIPALRERVTDLTGTLSGQARSALELKLKSLETQTGSQVAVLIVPTTGAEPIEAYALRVVEAWQLGREKIDDGVLFLVAMNDRRMRIEVGYGLEGALPDARAKRIIEDIVAPKFLSGDYPGGIEAGVDAIATVVRGEPLPRPQPPQATTGGFTVFSLLPVILIVSMVLGGSFKRSLGTLPGALVTGGIVGFIGWLLVGLLGAAIVAGIVGFLVTLFTAMGPGSWSSSGHGRGGFGGGFGGGGGGFGGGGGGFGGGGGSFGGGGSSGGW
ncbi:MAG: hypothetical protein C0629_15525 [Chromatiales bacterium]|jgi:uncharacterized protein|nr:YgcG family protein [Chromatiales bacterium]PLX54848.1 MAG: hypothetical protein C0629_15525 [Chromatiales bacterium]